MVSPPVVLTPVGLARTSRTATETTPVQSALNAAEHGVVEVFEEYADGLTGLAGFDYAWLLCWLHRPRDTDERVPMRQVPFLAGRGGEPVGLFAMRGPRRVTPVGLSLVRVVSVRGRTIRFAGVDMVDGTPVLDVKPYVTRFDRPPGEPRCGWFDDVDLRDGVAPADLDP